MSSPRNITAQSLDELLNPSMEDIIRVVAERNRLSSKDLIGRSRKAYINEARDDAIAEIYVRLRDVTLTDIGIALGGRHYSTIKASLERREIDVPISGVIDREAVVADAKEGMSVGDLAYKHHCSRASIRRIFYEAKVPIKE
jgi:hypothetical protein